LKRDHIKVEDHVGLVRDRTTRAILNINKNEIREAKLRKEVRKQKEQELNDIKNELRDLKEIVHKLIERQ